MPMKKIASEVMESLGMRLQLHIVCMAYICASVFTSGRIVCMYILLWEKYVSTQLCGKEKYSALYERHFE